MGTAVDYVPTLKFGRQVFSRVVNLLNIRVVKLFASIHSLEILPTIFNL